jgi:hypothetical protein
MYVAKTCWVKVFYMYMQRLCNAVFLWFYFRHHLINNTAVMSSDIQLKITIIYMIYKINRPFA